MALKELSHEKKILFLKLFSLELIKTAYREQHLKQVIETEKLRQKYVQPNIPPESALKMVGNQVFQPSEYPIRDSGHIKSRQLPIHRNFYRMKPRPVIFSQPIKKPFLRKIKKIIRKQQEIMPPQIEALQQIQPQSQPKPKGLNLGRIEIFFSDPYLQQLECPGPNQNILVRKGNQINPTRMTISQEEINFIINSFSENARIPLTEGILKAAVGNLVISAVVSEFAGSRFIINRIFPHLTKNI